MNAASPPEPRVFHTLDALRGLAAVGVVVFHMSGAFAPVAAPSGYLAVDLFFMMSGVVLSHAYEVRFRAGMGTFDFMRARLIRLYPLYFLGTLLGITVTVASLLGRNSQHWDSFGVVKAAALALLFLPNLSASPVNTLFPLNIPCWSLFLELLVNILFVVAWPLLTSRRLIVVLALMGAAISLAILHEGNIDLGTSAATLWIGLARAIFGFSVGVLVARRVPSVPGEQSNLKMLALVGAVGVAICCGPVGRFRTAWDAFCVLAVFPLVVYLSTRVDPGPKLRRIATFLGVTLYAIYVLHSPLSALMNSTTRHWIGGSGAPVSGVAVLTLLLIGCWWLDRNMDGPVRRQLSDRIPTWRRISAVYGPS